MSGTIVVISVIIIYDEPVHNICDTLIQIGKASLKKQIIHIKVFKGKQQNGKNQRSLQENQDAKGTFHAKMDTINDRNGMDLTETENIQKRWQEYTELYKKDLHDPDNHDGVITHLDPDNLECKVKWALGSITTNKASGGDGIPVELLNPKR